MPAPGMVLLIATALVIGGLGIGLAVIVVLLLRISTALSDAGTRLGQLPEMLSPLDPVVSRLAGALSRLRALVDSDYVPGNG